jgi:hypothetical protein
MAPQLRVALLFGLCGSACLVEAADDLEPRDGGTLEFDEVVESEPLVLDEVELLESVELEGPEGDPPYAACPACARVRARTANSVVVEVYLDRNHGFSHLEIGVGQPDIRPLTIGLASPTASHWAIYSLSSAREIAPDSPVFVLAGRKPRKPVELEIID